MSVLVAGGAGFVGSHLCERLVRDGERVICVDNLITGRLDNVCDILGQPRFSFLHHDVVDPLPALPHVDRIYHLASPASPPVYQRYPVETMRVNSEGTRHLLDLAARHGARFLFASTSEVYGDPLVHPQPEDYRGNVSLTGPRSVYDAAKRYGEALTQTYAKSRGVETRIVRIFNTYGPRLDTADGRVVSNFVVQALAGEALTVYGDGSQTRSFQYIDDLVDGMVRLMASSCREPVNIGNPSEFTMLEFAHLVLRLTGSSSEIAFLPLPVDDPRQRRPEISRARAVLEWEPRVPVEVGLMRTIAYFRDQLPRDAKQSYGLVATHAVP